MSTSSRFGSKHNNVVAIGLSHFLFTSRDDTAGHIVCIHDDTAGHVATYYIVTFHIETYCT